MICDNGSHTDALGARMCRCKGLGGGRELGKWRTRTTGGGRCNERLKAPVPNQRWSPKISKFTGLGNFTACWEAALLQPVRGAGCVVNAVGGGLVFAGVRYGVGQWAGALNGIFDVGKNKWKTITCQSLAPAYEDFD